MIEVTGNAGRMKNKYLIYLYFVLFLTFFLTLFHFVLSFGHVLFDFFSVSVRFPFTELLINFNYLLLTSLIFILYRRWRAEMIRRKSNEGTLLSLQKVVETMQIGVTITDPKGKILYTNPAEAEMHGYRVEDLMGKDARIFGPPEIWKPISQPILKRFRRETINVRKDGSTFPVQLMSDIVTTPEGDVFATVTTCEDITDRRKNEETIRQLAFYDALTGLPNRALFNDRLSQELAKARRHKKMLFVMFIDLDRFKIVNDSLGHDIGDLLIQVVARRLKNTVREGDTVSRMGGDEFVLFFPEIACEDDISVIAKKILERLADVFVLDDKELYITASIGISIFPENGNDVEILVKNADAAMYYAKDRGRNNYQFYSSTINANAIERVRIQSNLRKALKQNEFIVHYQPQVDLRSGRIVGAEALARWWHPDYGLVSPKEFIPLAEESGLISTIGEYLLFTACAQNKAWQEAGFSPIRMAVNISTYQFIKKDFVGMLKRLLGEIDLEPKYLELEFTESILMKDSDLIASTIHEIKSLGIQCAIDDFGTGYSSLSYLKYLPISKIKLDQSFVGSLSVDPNDEAISRAVITMAHDLKLRVTAEGVESVQQLEFLRSHDCDEAQGFLFSRPLPAKDFVGLLIDESHEFPTKETFVLDQKGR
jgi:diguanylate cyclase (GGDEF)-like protein/PAS domain S-box-containing protein